MYSELEQKICSKCKELKCISLFGKDCSEKLGVSSWCKLCKKSWRTQFRKDNPIKHKEEDFRRDLGRHYGITSETYYGMFATQNGKCACCGKDSSEFKRGLHVDHDH